jgi:hypothetical protein
MGYHNHSAVSKGLKRVRDMAARFFDENSPHQALRGVKHGSSKMSGTASAVNWPKLRGPRLDGHDSPPLGYEHCSVLHKHVPARTPGGIPLRSANPVTTCGPLAANSYALSRVEQVVTGTRTAEDAYDEYLAESGKQ